ncbi:MAG: D-alanyl-D-alanine carboxypeptidase family protein, partial [Bacteroidetes bacterium]|nr:D-alanyl-D-alanine carboxypeptidase family protein [Bacteroidota bacterium]
MIQDTLKITNVYLLAFLLISVSLHAQKKSPYISNVNTEVEYVGGKAYHKHIVLYGQTLFSLARAYGSTVNDIIAHNPRSAKVIIPGQALLIPISQGMIFMTHEPVGKETLGSVQKPKIKAPAVKSIEGGWSLLEDVIVSVPTRDETPAFKKPAITAVFQPMVSHQVHSTETGWVALEDQIDIPIVTKIAAVQIIYERPKVTKLDPVYVSETGWGVLEEKVQEVRFKPEPTQTVIVSTTDIPKEKQEELPVTMDGWLALEEFEEVIVSLETKPEDVEIADNALVISSSEGWSELEEDAESEELYMLSLRTSVNISTPLYILFEKQINLDLDDIAQRDATGRELLKTYNSDLTLSNKITLDHLMGKIDPRLDRNFVAISKPYSDRNSLFLRKAAAESFKRMWEAARNDGIDLTIISATRTYNQQKRIWEEKWTGKRKVEGEDLSKLNLTEIEKAKKILRYSSMPGSSQHHWGTDIDINALNDDYFNTYEGLRVYNWLSKNAEGFGFYQPYTNESGIGYEEEKWHWSYKPLSNKFQEEYRRLITYDHFKGFYGAK